MNKKEWLTAAEALAQTPVPFRQLPDSYGVARQMLVDLNDLITSAPQDVLHVFAAVPNAEFDVRVLKYADRLTRGIIRFSPLTLDERSLIVDLCALLRALDDFVAEMGDSLGPTEDPAAWRVGEVYVIPRLYPRRAAPIKGDGRDDLGNFATRVLRRHRILPAEVGGYPLKLAVSSDRLGRDDPPVYGAGLFPNLELQVEVVGAKFTASGVACPNQSEIIGDHLAAGHLEGCAVVAFPELTIDTQMRRELQLALQKATFRTMGTATQVRLVVAGSWHELEAEHLYNVATVFDGFGEPVLSHRKLFPYFNINYGTEGIASGGEISVLVMEDAIIAFGVCRDFCEHGDRNPYLDVDADLFLVVSFGKEESMDGHLTTAKLVRRRFRAHSFVIQQDDSDYLERLGYVLTPYDDVSGKASEMERKDAWVVAKV